MKLAANAFDRKDILVALGIFVLAFSLRYLGIRFGLPYFHHWDEGWLIDNTASILETRAWRPQTYQYGAPPSLIAALVVHALRVLEPAKTFAASDGALLRLIGRHVTVIISASGAFAVYLCARFATAGDRDARVRAIYAAAIYAVAAELITHGRYAATDANLVALTAWTLAFGALYVRGGRTLWGVATVASAAVAVAFKLTAGSTLLVPVILLLLRAGTLRERALRFAWAASGATVIFFALNPHVLIHWSAAVGDIRLRVNQTVRGGLPEFLLRSPGFEQAAAEANALFVQLFHRWPWASAIAGALAFSGILVALRQRSVIVMVAVVQSLFLLGGFAMSSRAFLYRNYLTAAPVLCIGFGFAMASIHAWIAAKGRTRALHAAIATPFAVVFVGVALVQSIRCERLSVDARTRALDWMSARVGSERATVTCTTSVVADVMGIRDDLRPTRARPGLKFTPDVMAAEDALRAKPDYVLVASYPDRWGRGEVWPFQSLPGYQRVAEFECNPYEHNFAITPTWGGRFNALVLERIR